MPSSLGYSQEESKLEIMETLPKHSSDEGNCMSQQDEGKVLDQNAKGANGQRPYECEVCFKKFSQNYRLKNHLRINTGEKPYKCEICFKKFSDSGDLKRHLRVHTGEKPYKCEICCKYFNQASTLTTHLRMHSGEKPYKYKCEVCCKHEICLKQFCTTICSE
uniref:Zinc finger protein 723-like n=1 Tax=Diabrotica virgifera virgifera TaxID=50390 RepID=A0A6P7H7J2_DIAVI